MIPIGEVVARSGLRASALRYYEQVGLIAPLARVGGRRHYDPSVLDRLRVIAGAQAAGFTIGEIRGLLVEDGCAEGRWQPLARRKIGEIDELIERAQATRRLLEESLRCQCRALEECSLLSAAGHGRSGASRGGATGRRVGRQVALTTSLRP